MHALGRLITERMEHPDNRWSLTDVVNRMRAAGHTGVGKSRLGQLRNDPVESIKKDVILALADGLGVTPLTVANAALDAMGIETRPVEVTDSIQTAKIDPSLSDGNRRVIIAMIREMRVDPSAGTGGFVDAAERFIGGPTRDELLYAARTAPPGYVSPGRAARDEQDKLAEQSQDQGGGDE